MERGYRVYRYQNLVVPTRNYIGSTGLKNQSQRAGKNGGHYIENCPKFGSAIIEYGWPNFEYSVLADNLTKEEAERLEQHYIEYYDSINQGYNVSLGGRGGAYGVHRSDETKKRISDANKGKSLSDETRKKISEGRGVNGVLQYTKDGQFRAEYPSMQEASRRTGISPGNICNCCKGKLMSAGGFIWKFA